LKKTNDYKPKSENDNHFKTIQEISIVLVENDIH